MKNQEIARILSEIGFFLEIKGEAFKPRAYQAAAHTLRTLSEDIEHVAKEGRLEELPGIGSSIAKKIKEYLETGTISYYDRLKKEIPIAVEELMAVEGLGPKTIKLLHKELGVRNLADLEKALKHHKIRELPRMGEKSEEQLLRSVLFLKKHAGRKLLGDILPIAEELAEAIRTFPGVIQVAIAGSTRRMKETIGDIDILVTTTTPQPILDRYVALPAVEDVVAKGDTKATVRLKAGLDADLRVIPPESFGAAMLYFTGCKEMNIELRKIAKAKGWKLNEYGLFQDEEMLAGKTEEEIFRQLGLDYIEPELRENRGELEAAAQGRLPKLLPYDSLRGDLQMHTKWSDGVNTIKEMALAAKKCGYEYLAITDHTGSLRIAGGMDEAAVAKQMTEIARLNEELADITILAGVEVNIDAHGNLDLANLLLKDLDVVVASIHTGFKQSEEQLTQRLISVMENEYVNIIAHPTGRKLLEREGYELNFEMLFEKAKETKTILEINAFPNRLDLNDLLVKQAVEAGCKLAINTDAHSVEHLRYIRLGIATARRGWAKETDVINTLPLTKLQKFLEK
ncbi:MAG: DNA polymerase/3'-5' exonuclease PolX [Candidatus Heimdallarchaeota archaeon]|nr:DNA polymerase/3'-5' exonuclease PolX [Candidatus Heimdallarchaeota archaeon]